MKVPINWQRYSGTDSASFALYMMQHHQARLVAETMRQRTDDLQLSSGTFRNNTHWVSEPKFAQNSPGTTPSGSKLHGDALQLPRSLQVSGSGLPRAGSDVLQLLRPAQRGGFLNLADRGNLEAAVKQFHFNDVQCSGIQHPVLNWSLAPLISNNDDDKTT